MNMLVLGATGATGRHLTNFLIDSGHQITIVVRSPEKLPAAVKDASNVKVVKGTVLKMNDEALDQLLNNCDVVFSCLGHNLTLKGMYGHPRKLVTDTALRIVKFFADNKRETPVKYVLMNTTGNVNKLAGEKVSLMERIVVSIIRVLVPPHVDNEKAAEVFSKDVGGNSDDIEWVAVRPDSLIDAKVVTEYSLFQSPQRSAIFNSGKTSRINVAHFMKELGTNDKLWEKWNGQMPVIYNND
ncbi:MAG: hypothetical protein SCALA702_13290 [Melioribacteraceae bacterium]|nr:MAG: hypothetical protein SCALA702_13290 [Melioribacteraceae bacterium]